MRRAAVTLSALCLVALAACGGGDRAAGPPTTEATTTTTVYSGPVAPLTGLPTDDASLATKPLLTVKIDNHPQGRPQFGIEKADVIVEEKVEGDLSRFMALYHSQESGRVGPVRSLRTTDARWLKAEGGLMAYSGGIGPVKQMLRENGIVDIGADNHGPRYYKRRSDRPFEHAMYVDTSVLRELTPPNTRPAKPLFEYLRAGEPFGGTTATPVSSISGRFGGGPTAASFSWNWDPSASLFKRGTDGAVHNIEGLGQIGMPNVVVQFVQYQQTAFRDRANSAVDEAIPNGTGEAWVLSGGKIVKGTWNRPTLDDVTTFVDSAGVTIKLQPGQTWLMLFPTGQPVAVQ